MSSFQIVTDFFAKQKAYVAVLQRLRAMFGPLSSGGGGSEQPSAPPPPPPPQQQQQGAADLAVPAMPSVLYWIPTVLGVPVVVPSCSLECCYGIEEVVQEWLDVWARYLLREDLLKVAASLAIGLAGYSGADSIFGAQSALKNAAIKVQRMLALI